MKRSLVMSIILIMCLQAMDAPLKPLESQEIPADIQIKYSQERDRFKSYDLNNPENKFLPLMHAQFEKNEHNLFPYLGYLNIFVNLLLAQHFLLNTAADIYYLNHEITKVREKEKSLTIQLGGVVDPSNPTQSIIKVPNIDNLNEVIAHTSILNKTKEILTPEELQVVFNWLFDDRFDSWMKLLSEHRLLLNILQPLQKLRSTKRHTLDRQLNEIDASLNKQLFTPPQLIQKNMHPMQSLSEANQKAYKRFINYQKKDIKRETTFNSMMEDNYNEIAAEGHLYLYTHAWYEQLYKIVRAEMKAVITQLMKLEPKKIKEISSLATNSFTNDFPEKVLPLELPAFVNPALSIALPNLDKERAQAKKVWEEEQNI